MERFFKVLKVKIKVIVLYFTFCFHQRIIAKTNAILHLKVQCHTLWMTFGEWFGVIMLRCV